MNDPKEIEYHREILFLAITTEAIPMSVFSLLPLNHDLPLGYFINRKATGAQAIKAWHVFAGEE
jgi:hypothetical protein